jgi:2-phospho-L-lactate guanylyltransferase
MVSILLLLNLHGKKRLHLYTEEQREKLILFLFERILTVLKGMKVYILTPDDMPESDYTVIKDEWRDINKVVTKARSHIIDDVLILPCDLPFVEQEDIQGLCKDGVKIVPSQNGGTNALFLPMGVSIETKFGKNSFEKHVKILEEKNVEYEIYKSDKFRDIDTEEDIIWALEHEKDSAFSNFIKELDKSPLD